MTIFAACASPVHYLPLATTVVATVFLADLIRRYCTKGKGIHLLWWAGGVATYGIGTALESIITLAGNTLLLNKSWYVMGAILGAYPLAQGTVYLLLRRRTANLLTAITLPFVFVTIALVALCPIDLDVLEPHRPGGRALEWSWLRSLTPLINGYAALFLVGGAVFSSWRFASDRTMLHRAVGNALIAIGAIMPGIGGIVAKTGTIETLYITELTGLIFIWAGYCACVWPGKRSKSLGIED